MGIVQYMPSYGLLLFVVVAALYFFPGPDPRDRNPMPARRMTHPNGRRYVTTVLTPGIGVRAFS